MPAGCTSDGRPGFFNVVSTCTFVALPPHDPAVLVGTLYPEHDVGTSLLEARGVPTVTPPNSWSVLAFAAARKADKMTGGLGIAMAATPGAAWAESGLEEAFPGSFKHLRSLADRPDEAAEFCEDLLARYQDMVDREALGEVEGKSTSEGNGN